MANSPTPKPPNAQTPEPVQGLPHNGGLPQVAARHADLRPIQNVVASGQNREDKPITLRRLHLPRRAVEEEIVQIEANKVGHLFKDRKSVV